MDRTELSLKAGAALLALLLCAGAQAEIYKWTDAQGKAHFGDRAPADAPSSVATPRPAIVAGHEDLRLTITEHGRALPEGIRARAEAAIQGMVRVYREVFGLDLRRTVVVDAHILDNQPALQVWARANAGQATADMIGVYLTRQRLVGVVNAADDPEETLHTLIHEANHVILAQLSPRSPPWLHEGLSQYFEGIELVDDRIVVHPHVRNDEAVRYLMAHQRLIQLHDYLAIPPGQWQKIAHVDNNPMPYIIAWSLTSFLMSQPFKRQLLGGMMQDLEKANIPPDLDAFVRRYPGGLTVLEFDWYKWAQQPAAVQALD